MPLSMEKAGETVTILKIRRTGAKGIGITAFFLFTGIDGPVFPAGLARWPGGDAVQVFLGGCSRRKRLPSSSHKSGDLQPAICLLRRPNLHGLMSPFHLSASAFSSGPGP